MRVLTLKQFVTEKNLFLAKDATVYQTKTENKYKAVLFKQKDKDGNIVTDARPVCVMFGVDRAAEVEVGQPVTEVLRGATVVEWKDANDATRYSIGKPATGGSAGGDEEFDYDNV